MGLGLAALVAMKVFPSEAAAGFPAVVAAIRAEVLIRSVVVSALLLAAAVLLARQARRDRSVLLVEALAVATLFGVLALKDLSTRLRVAAREDRLAAGAFTLDLPEGWTVAPSSPEAIRVYAWSSGSEKVALLPVIGGPSPVPASWRCENAVEMARTLAAAAFGRVTMAPSSPSPYDCSFNAALQTEAGPRSAYFSFVSCREGPGAIAFLQAWDEHPRGERARGAGWNRLRCYP